MKADIFGSRIITSLLFATLYATIHSRTEPINRVLDPLLTNIMGDLARLPKSKAMSNAITAGRAHLYCWLVPQRVQKRWNTREVWHSIESAVHRRDLHNLPGWRVQATMVLL